MTGKGAEQGLGGAASAGSSEEVMAKLIGWVQPPSLISVAVGSRRGLWPDVLSGVTRNVQQAEAVGHLRGQPTRRFVLSQEGWGESDDMSKQCIRKSSEGLC